VQVDFELVVEQLKLIYTLRGRLVSAPAPALVITATALWHGAGRARNRGSIGPSFKLIF
jgi:hypothetical protein